ncbi:MAG: hypothetical protein QM496_04795 [Verrucomicrobiota bacterium]
MRLIHISWDGPHTLSDLKTLRNEDKDYGLYAIYGSHPMYGPDVLLYLGKASEQTLGVRIGQESWLDHEDHSNIKIYVGRLCGPRKCSDDEWSGLILDAERLMIYAHTPAYNSQNVASIPYKNLRDIHVLNWGSYRRLIPEVSGARWSDIHDELDAKNVFTSENS